MTLRIDLVGIVVEDMGRSLAFYRQLGLDFPDDADTQPHVDITLPGGLRLAWDLVETIRSFDPSWRPPGGGGARPSPAGEGVAPMSRGGGGDGPGQVDATYERLVGGGHRSHLAPFDAFWGQRYA